MPRYQINRDLSSFINKHENETIYVIGTGPSLLDLTPSQIKKIETDCVSVGVNFCHFLIDPTYWISAGHGCHAAYALEYASENTKLFWSQGTNETRFFPDNKRLINLCDVSGAQAAEIRKDFNMLGRNDVIVGLNNILNHASHIAYILGANRIVYLGFEQTNCLHFYSHFDDDKKEQIVDRIKFLMKKYENDKTTIYPPHGSTISVSLKEIIDTSEDPEQRWCHFHPFEVLKSLPFKKGNNKQNINDFNTFMEKFKEEGIEVLTTAKEGIIVDVGGKTVDLDEILWT